MTTDTLAPPPRRRKPDPTMRPAPQPHNRIAPTFEEQLAFALAERRPAPTPDQKYRRLARHVSQLQEVVAELVGREIGGGAA